MAKLAFRGPIAEYTTVTPRNGKGRIHAFARPSIDRTVCGRKTLGWIVTADRTEGNNPTRESLTCPRCKAGCK